MPRRASATRYCDGLAAKFRRGRNRRIKVALRNGNLRLRMCSAVGLSDPSGTMSAMEGTQTRPLRDRDDLTAVLRKGFDLIRPAAPRLRHRLVGTASACLQGVELSVGDIDLLLARRDDVDAVAAALAHLPCVAAPQWIEVSRQYYACYSIDGVGFSFSTVEAPSEEDGWECIGPGP